MMVDMKQIFVADNYQDEGHYHEILVVHFGPVRNIGIYILHEQEITPYDQRIREVKASILHHQPYQLGYGKSHHYLRLTAMLK